MKIFPETTFAFIFLIAFFAACIPAVTFAEQHGRLRGSSTTSYGYEQQQYNKATVGGRRRRNKAQQLRSNTDATAGGGSDAPIEIRQSNNYQQTQQYQGLKRTTTRF